MVKNGAKATPNARIAKSYSYAHAVQCVSCMKWRFISKEEYEEIRSKTSEDPFVCNKKPNVSCEDAADLEHDSSRTWAVDRADLPKTPAGFQRKVTMRKDFSKMDVHYIAPNEEKIRASTEIPNFLREHPEYNLSPADFSFVAPRVVRETVPEYDEKKAATASGNKKMKMASEDA